jgi:hypothetical protein
MNTSANITENASEECHLLLFSTEVHIAIFNVMRIIFLLLYVGFMVFLIKVKNLQNRHMVLLFNMVAVGVFYLIYSVTFIFYSSCYNPSQIVCFFQAIINVFVAYDTGYAISAVALHRLIFAYFIHVVNYLTKRVMLFIIVILWLIPLFLTLIHIFVIEYMSYTGLVSPFGICLNKITNPMYHLIFFAIFGFLIPNLLIIGGFATSYHRLKIQAKRTRANKDAQPIRVTIQIVVHVLLYELDLISSMLLFLMAPDGVLENFIQFIPLLLAVKGLNHFNALAMMYFHPIMLETYKKYFRENLSISHFHYRNNMQHSSVSISKNELSMKNSFSI